MICGSTKNIYIYIKPSILLLNSSQQFWWYLNLTRKNRCLFKQNRRKQCNFDIALCIMHVVHPISSHPQHFSNGKAHTTYRYQDPLEKPIKLSFHITFKFAFTISIGTLGGQDICWRMSSNYSLKTLKNRPVMQILEFWMHINDNGWNEWTNETFICKRSVSEFSW